MINALHRDLVQQGTNEIWSLARRDHCDYWAMVKMNRKQTEVHPVSGILRERPFE
jgi:hypothetical protein